MVFSHGLGGCILASALSPGSGDCYPWLGSSGPFRRNIKVREGRCPPGDLPIILAQCHTIGKAADVLNEFWGCSLIMCSLRHPFKEGCVRASRISAVHSLSCLEGGQENEIHRLCYCTSRLFVLISDTHLLELLKMNYTSYRNRTFREFHSSCEH